MNNNWKVILEHNQKTFEILVEAESYSDAYMKTERDYPNCRIISIKVFKTRKK